MSTSKLSLPILLMAASFLYPQVADAILATPATGATSNLSHKVALGAVTAGGATATAGAAKDNNLAIGLGVLSIFGGLGLSAIDPPGGTIHDGSFTYHYPDDLVTIVSMGWLGAWGADPTLPTLPADPDDWAELPDHTFVELQAHHANLQETISGPAGARTVSFDWGATPFEAQSPEPFNFYAVLFQFTRDVLIENLGDFDTPPAGANLFVSTPGYRCSLLDETLIQLCGMDTTSYFRVTAVSEPTSPMLVVIAGMVVLLVRRLNRDRRIGC